MKSLFTTLKFNSTSHTICFLFFLFAGLFLYSLPATDWLRSAPGDLGDARFNSFILEHLYQWASSQTESLWSPPFFYPYSYTLAFSDNHFGSGLIYVLLRTFGLPRETAFSGWFVIGCTLNFISAYFCLRQLAFSCIAAGIGGLIYAFFLPADLLQEQHVQLVYRYATPLSALYMIEALLKRRVRGLGWASFWLAVQFFCSIYLGLFLFFLLAAMTLSAWIVRTPPPPLLIQDSWRQLQKREKFELTLLIVLPLVCIVGLLYVYRWVAKIYGFQGSKEQVLSLLPTPSSYLLADHTPYGVLLGKLLSTPPLLRDEHQLFFGFGVWILIILGVYALYKSRNQKFDISTSFTITTLMCTSALILIALTLKVDEYSLYQALTIIPGIQAIRAVGRIILTLGLPIAILGAFACDSILDTVKKTSLFFKFGILIFLIGCTTIELMHFHHYSTPFTKWHERQSLIEKLAGDKIQKDSIIFVTGRKNEGGEMAEIDGMIFAQDYRLLTLNGYSGNTPPGYNWTEDCSTAEKRLTKFSGFNENSSLKLDHILNRIVSISLGKCSE